MEVSGNKKEVIGAPGIFCWEIECPTCNVKILYPENANCSVVTGKCNHFRGQKESAEGCFIFE